MRARGASIQTAATKVTNMLYLSSSGRQLVNLVARQIKTSPLLR